MSSCASGVCVFVCSRGRKKERIYFSYEIDRQKKGLEDVKVVVCSENTFVDVFPKSNLKLIFQNTQISILIRGEL